ncbi:LysE family transporter [Pseudarthrobacter sulfonivorans]|uniref:LysE family translocator n=1 Tax=Pseudarthrobacter sulfonivorans TaxID=121292 RepID=UPI002861D9B3|nr:LysE family transporter [Pseudarthrobacter sulfonivorans]MDR6415516.1 threonine/homoserine/homoserine lactone efflux protein [Pseudarthrobacter sulfonivorans]
MTITQAVLSFAVVAGLLTLVPGIDTALVLRSSISKARSFTFATALGICTAMVWGVAAAVGVSALLAASDLAYRILMLAGAAYMVWLGTHPTSKACLYLARLTGVDRSALRELLKRSLAETL